MEDDFLETKVNYAVVISCNLSDVQRFKQILTVEDVNVIFQKVSIGKLFIKDENENG